MPTDTRNKDLYRLVFGVASSFIFAMLAGWSLAYLSTIATCILIAAKSPIPAKSVVIVTLMVAVICQLIYGLFTWLSFSPLFLLITLFLSCYFILYLTARGAPKIVTLVALLTVLVISSATIYAPQVSWWLAKWLPVNVFVAFVTSYLAIKAFPHEQGIKAPEPIHVPIKQARERALELSLAIVPVIIFLWLQRSLDFLALVFLTLFIHRLVECTSLRLQVTAGYMIANVVGDALAVICFEILVLAPSIALFVLLSISGVSLLSLKMYQDERSTVLSFTAINAFVALTGAATLYDFSETEVGYISRLIQIFCIALYLLVFLAMTDWLKTKVSTTTHTFVSP